MIRTSPNRVWSLIFGVVYIALGLLGWLVTAGIPFASPTGGMLVIFSVNPLLNIVHLIMGLLLLWAGFHSATAAKGAASGLGGLFLAMAIVGVFILPFASNILALNVVDNILHFITGVILVVAAARFDKKIPQGAYDAI